MSDTPVIDRVRLRALAEQATSAPWFTRKAQIPVGGQYDYAIGHGSLGVIAEAFGRSATDKFPPAEANAEFIAAARNAILSLLDAADERDRLAARVEQLEIMLREHGKHIYGCPGLRLGYPDSDECTCGLAAALKGSNP